MMLYIAVLTYDGSQVDRATIENKYKNDKKVFTEENPCTVANCPFENYLPSSGFDCSNLHVHELKLLFPTPPEELPDSDNVA